MLLKKKKLRKLHKEFVNKFLDVIENNEEYLNFIEENKKQLKINETEDIDDIKFYDVFDNSQLNKLIKGIRNLSNLKYDVDLSLNFKKVRELNYLTVQYDYTRRSFIGKVVFKDDLFIDKINLAYTQINNSEVIVEFNISFKKFMNRKLWIDFIKENKELVIGKWFLSFYNVDEPIKLKNFKFIYGALYNLRESTLQAKLLDVFPLNLGKIYDLPQVNAVSIQKKYLKEETFKDIFLKKTIVLGKNYMVVDFTGTQGTKVNFYYSRAYSSPLTNLLRLFATYRMDFYYYLFEDIERIEINERINKYFLKTSKRISSRDYRWLINKMRSLNDNKLLGKYKETRELVTEWKAYINGQETPLDFANGEYTEKYSIIYSESLDHIRMAYSIQKENLVIYLASGSLIASLIGVILTLILK
ncbi:hypothetical protein ACTHPT_14275 [Bacillus altitudinis]|uniref:hypothetical protein n=1 Tax=Bacillus altitudinis TaxID=293387 RepID=UPI003F7BB3BD